MRPSEPTISRRSLLASAACAPLAQGAAAEVWTAEWDRLLIDKALASQEAAFDPKEHMLARKVSGEYNYHSQIRNRTAHPTRESLMYALLLLEAGGDERRGRAAAIVDRVIALQDTDPASKWYGIWGYYAEEPPPQMSPADFNWADFNGSTLLLIAHRHGARLPADVRKRVLESIGHAARSVERRNVTMAYTNIAVQGTFVTLAAAEMLGDRALDRYAKDRLRRFAETVDASGSFNEYNSPTYANVTIVNLTRIRMMLRDPEVLARVDRLHERAWLHLGRHWHFPTRQLAGPMSRCYSTDIGAPLWIQKALQGRLPFLSLGELRAARLGDGSEVAIHDYRCPDTVAPLFLEPGKPRQHREVFVGAAPGDAVHLRPTSEASPIHGTTWLDPAFCLGSANRSDFWIQRRPLLAYWGGSQRPARFAQLRFLKDDYDFSSALFYSVQERGFVLGLVNFRSPGGDKHISLDPIANGEFTASRLRLCLDLAGLPAKAAVLSDASRAAIDLGGAKLWLQIRRAVFAEDAPRLSVGEERGRTVVSVDLIPPGSPRTIRWKDAPSAHVLFTLAMEGGGGSLADFDRRCRGLAFASDAGQAKWSTPAGELSLAGGVGARPVAEQDRAFVEQLNGAPVPLVRLSNDKLA